MPRMEPPPDTSWLRFEDHRGKAIAPPISVYCAVHGTLQYPDTERGGVGAAAARMVHRSCRPRPRPCPPKSRRRTVIA